MSETGNSKYFAPASRAPSSGGNTPIPPSTILLLVSDANKGFSVSLLSTPLVPLPWVPEPLSENIFAFLFLPILFNLSFSIFSLALILS